MVLTTPTRTLDHPQRDAFQAVTHDGVFHADDVFAAATLQLLNPETEITRTRNPLVIAAAHIAFDVGGGDYDHHQPQGGGVRPNGIPYAAFGLIWRDYGKDLCWDWDVAAEVDRILVQPIDAADNGLHLSMPTRDDVHGLNISGVISMFNPVDGESFDGQFAIATAVARTILRRAITNARERIDGRRVLASAIANAVDPRILVFESFVPGWQETIVRNAPNALLVVYPSAGTYRVQVIPQELGKPGVRLPLPEVWAGLDGEALISLTGVADATFAHRGRFIAGAQSQDGALTLARLALV